MAVGRAQLRLQQLAASTGREIMDRTRRSTKLMALSLHVPTLTAVFPSSSEALLPPPPCLLLMLMRLELRFWRIMALMGRCVAVTPAGEPGGDAMFLSSPSLLRGERYRPAVLCSVTVRSGWRLGAPFGESATSGWRGRRGRIDETVEGVDVYRPARATASMGSRAGIVREARRDEVADVVVVLGRGIRAGRE